MIQQQVGQIQTSSLMVNTKFGFIICLFERQSLTHRPILTHRSSICWLTPHMPTIMPRLDQIEARSLEPHSCLSHTGGRNPRTWATTCHCQGTIGRSYSWKWSQDSNPGTPEWDVSFPKGDLTALLNTHSSYWISRKKTITGNIASFSISLTMVLKWYRMWLHKMFVGCS